MAVTTVGRFTYDTETGKISGPADYMEKQGRAYIARLTTKGTPLYDRLVATAHLSPSIETAILVYVQTDYAGFRGYQQMFGDA